MLYLEFFKPRKHENNEKVLLLSLDLMILIINFLSTSLKIAIKILQKDNFKNI